MLSAHPPEEEISDCIAHSPIIPVFTVFSPVDASAPDGLSEILCPLPSAYLNRPWHRAD